jgi:hypothetical protein
MGGESNHGGSSTKSLFIWGLHSDSDPKGSFSVLAVVPSVAATQDQSVPTVKWLLFHAPQFLLVSTIYNAASIDKVLTVIDQPL